MVVYWRQWRALFFSTLWIASAGHASARYRQGQNAIEVANLDDLAAVIETVKSAVETGELDAQIEAASGSLKAGFKK